MTLYNLYEYGGVKKWFYFISQVIVIILPIWVNCIACIAYFSETKENHTYKTQKHFKNPIIIITNSYYDLCIAVMNEDEATGAIGN